MSGESTTIKTHCPCCGNLDLKPTDIVLRVRAGQKHQSWNHYQFTCPTCGDLIIKSAYGDVAGLLASAHVPIERVVFPLEVDEPIRHNQAPLDWDEVLDTIIELNASEVLNP